MATIKRLPGVRRFLGTPTGYVVHLRKGQLTHEGVGQAFWFSPATSVLSEVPSDDQELPLMFHAITVDHQDVTVQANVTFGFVDPVTVSQRLDFGIFPAKADATSTGLQQVTTIVGQVARSIAVDHLATMSLQNALRTGISEVRASLVGGLQADTRLQSTGLAVLGVHVLAIRPEADVEVALQTPVREQLQAEADRATYERRALAVERERAISENELASSIELATRREQLVVQEGANARRQAEEAATAALVETRAASERREIDAASRAQEVSVVGAAEAERETAKLAAYRDVDRQTLMALALRELVGSGALPKIDNLTITPDLLTNVLSAFTGRR
ncbi:MAG: SPFH domain-containing protein [Pseudoclavibacter sp.]